MPNPTRQEIIDAYETLDMLLGFSEDRNPDLVPERRRIIEKALPPRPRPTMADVEWDNDKHYLAEAERMDGVKVAMLKPIRLHPQIKCLAFDDGGFYIDYPDPEELTPTGRRYTLTEVQDD